ncbi:MAG: Dps family protein [Oligoflexus sp.]
MANVIDQLNQLVADANVMFTKLHNYHWNVKGLQFYALHEQTEQAYNYFAELYDGLAERVLQLGGKPIVTLKEILQRTKISEENGQEFSAEYVIKTLLKDYQYFLGAFRELSGSADNDPTTTAYADEQVAKLEKEVWMLQSNLA